jgi:predicted nucleic acid-binding Zn ribbon protein
VSAPDGKFCPYCGTSNPSDYRFCGQCQREIPPRVLARSAARRTRRRRWLLLLGAGLAAVGVAVAAAATIPVPTNFSVSVTSPLGGSPATVSETFPADAPIAFTWNTTDGGPTTFSVISPQGAVVGQWAGNGGKVSFVSAGGAYGFRSASTLYEVVDVDGTYVAPLLS